MKVAVWGTWAAGECQLTATAQDWDHFPRMSPTTIPRSCMELFCFPQSSGRQGWDFPSPGRQAGGVIALCQCSKGCSGTVGHVSLPTQLDRSRGPSSTLPWPQPPPFSARGAASGTTSRFTGWGPSQVRSSQGAGLAWGQGRSAQCNFAFWQRAELEAASGKCNFSSCLIVCGVISLLCSFLKSRFCKV